MEDFELRIGPIDQRSALLELRGFLGAAAQGSLRDAAVLLRRQGTRAWSLDCTRLEGLDGAGLLTIAQFLTRASGETTSLSAFGFAPRFQRTLERLGFSECVDLLSPDVGQADVLNKDWAVPRADAPKLIGPLEGFGQLWHKTYRLRVDRHAAPPAAAAHLLKTRLPEFWPAGNRLIFPPQGAVPGAVAQIVLRLAGGVPLRTRAEVIHADSASFTLAALAGHVEAGWIHFGARADGEFAEVQVQSLGRGGDPLYEAGLRLFGHADQERFWQTTLERMASHLGEAARVETSKVCVDARVRWVAAKNIWHSAALRTPFHTLGSLARPPETPPVAAGKAARGGAPERRTIVVLGGGYAGLACLRTLSARLSHPRYRLRLIDATPYHSIKTRFHERAVLASREALIRLPLSTLVAASGAEFIQDEASGIDFESRAVQGLVGQYPYDRLILALGGEIAYFAVEGAKEHTVSLQTYEQAVECCRRIAALGLGSRGQPARRVVVVGAGIEGLEVATMLRQVTSPEQCEILVLDQSGTLMAQSQCRDSERSYVRAYLERRGINLRLNAAIRAVGPGHVALETGERLASDLTFWCSGVRPVRLKGVTDAEGFRVGPCLQCEGHPEVFAAGDFATVESLQAAANLRSAQRAAYHGTLAAENVCLAEAGRPLKRARYKPIGELTALGDFDGMGLVYGVPLTGLKAALLKKAHEAKYLAETLQDFPGAVARGLLALGHRHPAG